MILLVELACLENDIAGGIGMLGEHWESQRTTLHSKKSWKKFGLLNFVVPSALVRGSTLVVLSIPWHAWRPEDNLQ